MKVIKTYEDAVRECLEENGPMTEEALRECVRRKLRLRRKEVPISKRYLPGTFTRTKNGMIEVRALVLSKDGEKLELRAVRSGGGGGSRRRKMKVAAPKRG